MFCLKRWNGFSEESDSTSVNGDIPCLFPRVRHRLSPSNVWYACYICLWFQVQISTQTRTVFSLFPLCAFSHNQYWPHNYAITVLFPIFPLHYPVIILYSKLLKNIFKQTVKKGPCSESHESTAHLLIPFLFCLFVCFTGVTTHRGCIFHSLVAGFSLLVFDVSRSHTTTPHIR